jgi:hypothetical protein
MALPEAPSEAETLLCQLKELVNIIIQEIKDLKAVTYPLAVELGGTGDDNVQGARVNLTVPSVEIPLLNIDWSLSGHFYKTITDDDAFTMSNFIDGSSIQVLLTASGADRTPSFPAAVNFPAALDPILEDHSSLYSITMVNGKLVGVVATYLALI